MLFADQLSNWMDDLMKKGRQIGAVRTDLPEGLLLEATFKMLAVTEARATKSGFVFITIGQKM